jgi:hypothetical protein
MVAEEQKIEVEGLPTRYLRGGRRARRWSCCTGSATMPSTGSG